MEPQENDMYETIPKIGCVAHGTGLTISNTNTKDYIMVEYADGPTYEVTPKKKNRSFKKIYMIKGRLHYLTAASKQTYSRP